ncbi:MAG: chromate transporter [Bacteroidales bacterium]|nr:chromate transporter [Bacteroidales bacterium]
MLLLKLFWTFFFIGLFTFGGGYAVIGIIQSEVVFAKGWITESMFTNIVAVSQMTPGPVGLNCSTYVGYEVMKAAGASQTVASLGSFTSSIAIVLPSFIVMMMLVRFYTRFHETPVFKDVMSALKPTVAGLIGASALSLMLYINLGEGLSVIVENFPDWKAWVVFAASLGLYLTGKVGPISILAAGAVAGLLIY